MRALYIAFGRPSGRVE